MSHAVAPSQAAGTKNEPQSPADHRWWALAVLALGLSMIVLDGTIVGVALPTIIRDLDLDLSDAQWVNAVYSVVFAALLLGSGRLGDRIGRLVGAPPGTVIVGETLSIRIFQALAAALTLRPDRRVVLSDNGNFPTDLYIAQGLIGLLGRGYELHAADPEDVEAAIDERVAVVLLTAVDYRTGRLHDMARITARA